MEKMNIKTNWKGDEGKMFEDFFAQIWGDKNLAKKKLTIKERFVDPRIESIYIYGQFNQEEIDKLLSFDSDYMTFEKKEEKISGLERHKTMKVPYYFLKFNENFGSIKNVFIYASLEKELDLTNYLVAKDDLYFAKQQLDCYDVLF